MAQSVTTMGCCSLHSAKEFHKFSLIKLQFFVRLNLTAFNMNNRVSYFCAVATFALLLCVSAADDDGKKPKKLQIGIKKRVENCEMKSRKGDKLHMHYTGTLDDGTEFDSSIPRGSPFTFTLGTGQVIKGWDQGLIGMCVGEKRKLVIPSDLGYGDRGSPPKIPPKSTLIFEVELLDIERRDDL